MNLYELPDGTLINADLVESVETHVSVGGEVSLIFYFGADSTHWHRSGSEVETREERQRFINHCRHEQRRMYPNG